MTTPTASTASNRFHTGLRNRFPVSIDTVPVQPVAPVTASNTHNAVIHSLGAP